MIVDINGGVVCSQCGTDLETGALTVCMVVSDLGEDGRVVVHHFCRFPRTGYPRGCAGNIMTPKRLEFYNGTLEIEPPPQAVATEETLADVGTPGVG
jgi:hypothetical protein